MRLYSVGISKMCVGGMLGVLRLMFSGSKGLLATDEGSV